MGVWGWDLNGAPHRVQRFSGENQMNTHNLAIVFGPTLFQMDGKDYKAGRVVEDLISHYVKIFNVGSALPLDQDGVRAFPRDGEGESVCFGDEGRGSMSLQTPQTPKDGAAGQGSGYHWEPASAAAVGLKQGLGSPDGSSSL